MIFKPLPANTRACQVSDLLRGGDVFDDWTLISLCHVTDSCGALLHKNLYFFVANHISNWMYPIAVAVYDFEAENPDEITLRAGDKIEVVEKDPCGWCTGTVLRTGAHGLFPANYVQEQ
jgi:hypothetical protein